MHSWRFRMPGMDLPREAQRSPQYSRKTCALSFGDNYIFELFPNHSPAPFRLAPCFRLDGLSNGVSFFSAPLRAGGGRRRRSDSLGQHNSRLGQVMNLDPGRVGPALSFAGKTTFGLAPFLSAGHQHYGGGLVETICERAGQENYMLAVRTGCTSASCAMYTGTGNRTLLCL